jgi:hypothetical protein
MTKMRNKSTRASTNRLKKVSYNNIKLTNNTNHSITMDHASASLASLLGSLNIGNEDGKIQDATGGRIHIDRKTNTPVEIDEKYATQKAEEFLYNCLEELENPLLSLFLGQLENDLILTDNNYDSEEEFTIALAYIRTLKHRNLNLDDADVELAQRIFGSDFPNAPDPANHFNVQTGEPIVIDEEYVTKLNLSELMDRSLNSNDFIQNVASNLTGSLTQLEREVLWKYITKQ